MLKGEEEENESLGGSREVVRGEMRFGSFELDIMARLLALRGRLGLCFRDVPLGDKPNLSISESFKTTTLLLFNRGFARSNEVGGLLSRGDTERGRCGLGLVLLYKDTLIFFFKGLL